MKAPKIQDLNKIEQKNTFATKIEAVKTESEQISKKTFSLHQAHLNYINSIALEMGQSRGKVVGASEALRIILEQHQEATNR
jgi:hypothetical protein